MVSYNVEQIPVLTNQTDFQCQRQDKTAMSRYVAVGTNFSAMHYAVIPFYVMNPYYEFCLNLYVPASCTPFKSQSF